MKATGIVRRIDDLGRVVIPKEIRRTMRIREGDPLEIFTNNDGEVIFKKYSPMGEMENFAADFAAAMAAGCRLAITVCDRDRCIAVGGAAKRDMLEKPITSQLEKIVEDRRVFENVDSSPIFALEGIERKICIVAPIVAAGDITGSIVLLETEQASAASDSDKILAEVAAKFLSSRTE